MANTRLTPILCLGLFAFSWVTSAFSAQAKDDQFLRMQEHFEKLYDRASVRHSFKQPSGAEIECVELKDQPALKHAASKGIATPPPHMAQLDEATAPKLSQLSGTEVVLEAGVHNDLGEEMYCQEGTIPVLRTPVATMEKFRSLDDMMRKHSSDAHAVLREGDQHGHLFESHSTKNPAFGPTSLHQYAHAAQYSLPNRGANVTINVWNPYTQANSEFSLGQLWVVKGSGSDLQTLEAGVQKYVNLYNNYNPNLFIYSTSNGYGAGGAPNQGCYNLQCGRFVQVNNTIVIGGSLSPISTSGGTQYEIQMAYYLWQGNWWFQFQGIWVGYYPGYLFNAAGLANGANVIDFGGEIIDDRSKHSYHTFTDMGSGQYPGAWFGQAAYMRNIYYWDSSNNAYWATGIQAYRDNAYCYDIVRYNNDANWHTYIFYGGPGYNTNCQ